MRSLLVTVALVAGCQHADRTDRVGHPDRVDRVDRADRPAPPAAAAPRVALVPAPLAWDLSEQDATTRLAAAGMAPRADELHAYYSTPEQFHATPGTIEVAHTVEPQIAFTPRPGWTGLAHYPTVGGALDRIELSARLTPDAAQAELRALERRFGPPDDRWTYPADAPAIAGSTRLVWVEDGIWLVAIASADGALSLSYRRDARPASAIQR